MLLVGGKYSIDIEKDVYPLSPSTYQPPKPLFTTKKQTHRITRILCVTYMDRKKQMLFLKYEGMGRRNK